MNDDGAGAGGIDDGVLQVDEIRLARIPVCADGTGAGG